MQQIIDCERYGLVDIPNVPRVFTVVGTFVNTSRLDYLAKTAHAARGIANIH